MRLTEAMRKTMIAVFAVFCVLILGTTVGLYTASGLAMRSLLDESIQSQLKATIRAAEDLVDVDEMLANYDSKDDFFEGVAESDYNKTGDDFDVSFDKFKTEWRNTVTTLRGLQKECDVTYIYTVVKFGDVYRLIYDTDEEDIEPFTDYTSEMNDEHMSAFKDLNKSIVVGKVEDRYGSYYTAALKVADNAILCVDIADGNYNKNVFLFWLYFSIILVVGVLILALFGVALVLLLRHIRKIQDELAKMANYDKLTDLPNRRYLLDQLSAMTSSKKKQTPFALYFIDLDNFKKVNDNAGHDAGDELLQNIAGYLSSVHENSRVFRPGAGSLNVTARVGGDEFIIIAPNITTDEEAGAFAQEILDGFKANCHDKNIEKYDVGLSIGVALYPSHIGNFHVLIKYADVAMYNAKRGGKNCYRVYDDGLNKPEEF